MGVSHTLKEKAELEEEVLRLKERLKSVKEMSSRLDADNEDLRMRLHTAHATLRQHHIHLVDANSSTGGEGSAGGRSIRTPGGRKLGSSGRPGTQASAGS